jgi:GT2 family glycosyltransferase
VRNTGRQRVALVAPFFGRELRGRKERFAFAFATHLALEGLALEVITTTTTPDAPDANFFVAGTDHTEPFPVHRFRVNAPDRVAYEEALLAARRGGVAVEERAQALLDERLRSPELLAHVRASADRYDAFLFVDLTVPTTVHALTDVAERVLLVPLLDDEPAARLPAVAAAVSRARMILCTTEAEALLVGELYGPAPRARTRVVGLGVDAVPAENLPNGRVNRVTRGRPYVLAAGDDDARTAASLRAGGMQVVALGAVDERDRAAFFAFARAVAVSGAGRCFVPEVAEAWAYGRPVLADANAPGAAALVRETGGGIVVPPDRWHDALSALPTGEPLRAMVRAGAAYVETRGGWRGVAARTSEAIDALGALDDGRSRDELLAHVAYLYPLVQRQRRTIEAMRVSRFWRLRDAWFATRRRFGIGPGDDPVQLVDRDARAVELAALGDPYQLFREHHRVRDEDVERMRAMLRFLPKAVAFGLVVDARIGGPAGIVATLRSLRDQVYEHWSARVVLGEPGDGGAELAALADAEPRIAIVPPGDDRFGASDVVGPLEPGDRLEPHALFELALALQDDADVVYADEDRIDDRGVPVDPWFKPDWSPETLLTRDYVGRPVVIRRALLERAGGVRDVFESAAWYEALLRATELTERVVHVAQVLCHRHVRNAVAPNDLALAVEVTLRRRAEPAPVRAGRSGLDVRFAVPGDERVCVIVPTRDRADLLRPCIASLFERTAYRAFEVLVVDNGSREAATAELLAEWERREPQRFRVLRDPTPFNYSRLNNEAARATTAEYLLLLNNDTEVIAPDWMDAMLGQARRDAVGAVGALLLYPDGTVQHAGVVLGILGLAGHAHRFLPATGAGYHGALELDTNYLALTGACLMIAKRKYFEVGGLDEALAVSYNDVDLCLKLRRAGYRNVFVPRARLYHYESKTRGGDDTPAKVARAMDEVATIRKRWPVWAARDPYYNPNLTVDAEDFGLRL